MTLGGPSPPSPSTLSSSTSSSTHAGRTPGKERAACADAEISILMQHNPDHQGAAPGLAVDGNVRQGRQDSGAAHVEVGQNSPIPQGLGQRVPRAYNSWSGRVQEGDPEVNRAVSGSISNTYHAAYRKTEAVYHGDIMLISLTIASNRVVSGLSSATRASSQRASGSLSSSRRCAARL